MMKLTGVGKWVVMGLVGVLGLGLGYSIGRGTAAKEVEHVRQQRDEVRSQLWEGSASERGASPVGRPEIAQSEVSPVDIERIESVELPVAVLEMLAAERIQVPGDDLFSPQDPVIDALAINDEEKDQLQQNYREQLKLMKAEEVGSTLVESQDDGSILLSVPALDIAREDARSRFFAAARRSLGGERGKVFLAAKQGGSMFGVAGSSKDYLVETEPTGDGTIRYRISEMDGDQRRIYVGNAIPDKLRHLTERAKLAPVLEAGEDGE